VLLSFAPYVFSTIPCLDSFHAHFITTTALSMIIHNRFFLICTKAWLLSLVFLLLPLHSYKPVHLHSNCAVALWQFVVVFTSSLFKITIFIPTNKLFIVVDIFTSLPNFIIIFQNPLLLLARSFIEDLPPFRLKVLEVGHHFVNDLL